MVDDKGAQFADDIVTFTNNVIIFSHRSAIINLALHSIYSGGADGTLLHNRFGERAHFRYLTDLLCTSGIGYLKKEGVHDQTERVPPLPPSL